MSILLFSVLVLALLTLVSFVLYIREYRLRQHLTQSLTDIQGTPDWASREALTVMSSAQKKAQAIITEAEMEALKTEGSADLGGRLIRAQLASFEAIYQKRFEENMKQVHARFDQYMSKTESEYQTFLKELEGRGSKLSNEVEKIAEARVNQVLFNFEQNLSSFLASSEQKSLDAVQLELRSARELIDSYRREQLKLIDENVVAVLEQTLSIVLRSRLSLKDQTDLVYESLERAKVEKFFG